jgi:hypothetical protein
MSTKEINDEIDRRMGIGPEFYQPAVRRNARGRLEISNIARPTRYAEEPPAPPSGGKPAPKDAPKGGEAPADPVKAILEAAEMLTPEELQEVVEALSAMASDAGAAPPKEPKTPPAPKGGAAPAPEPRGLRFGMIANGGRAPARAETSRMQRLMERVNGGRR